MHSSTDNKEPTNKKPAHTELKTSKSTIPEFPNQEVQDNSTQEGGLQKNTTKEETHDLGAKINQLRLAKGYSQRKLANLAGLTNTAISAIERNRVSPAINTLSAILKVLDFDLQTFFSKDWDIQHKKVIVRPEDLIELKDVGRGVTLKQVFNTNPSRNLGFLIEGYQPHSTTEEKITHEGEEIGTVLEGEIMIRHDGTMYHLKAGDSYVIDTSLPHTFMNPTDGISRVVSAHTPATY